MLRNLWYQDTHSLLNFLSDLPKQIPDDKVISVICPDPNTADILRNKLGHKFLVETISAGLKGLIADNDLPEIQISRKSELLFELWIAWKKFGLKESYQLFNNCFNLVTELRGFSTDSDQLIDLLKDANEELFTGVCFLLRYYQERNLGDENTVYHQLSTHSLQFGKRSIFVFFGFKHLSGNQIDMILNFAEGLDVYVPIAEDLREHLTFSDWPKWLMENGESQELKRSSAGPSFKIVYANRFLSQQYLNKLTKEKQKAAIYYWDRNELSQNLLDIPSARVSAKTSIDLFRIELSSIEKELTNYINSNGSIFIEKIESSFKHEQNSKLKNYRKLKVYYDLFENVKSFNAFETGTIGAQDLKVLIEKTRLDLPRNSMVWQNQSDEIKVGTFSEAFLSSQILNCFVIGEGLNFDVNDSLDETITSQLASLGPLRNFHLDSLYNKAAILSLSEDQEVVVLVNPNVFEKTKIFDSLKDHEIFSFNENEVLFERGFSFGEGRANTENVAVSPSRLQTYIDCPYRYFLQYITGQKALSSITSDYMNNEIGTIAHGVLAKAIPLLLDKKDLALADLINEELQKLGKNVAHPYREREVYETSLAAIMNTVDEFQKIPAGVIVSVLPEEKFSNAQFEGRLDLLLKSSSEEVFIFDYKKSGSSVPAEAEVVKGDVIQLTLYSSFFDLNKVGVLGYLCMESPRDSLIFYRQNSAHARWLKDQGFYDQAKWVEIQTEGLEEIHNNIRVIKEELDHQIRFEALPRANKNCNFCNFKSFCVR